MTATDSLAKAYRVGLGEMGQPATTYYACIRTLSRAGIPTDVDHIGAYLSGVRDMTGKGAP